MKERMLVCELAARWVLLPSLRDKGRTVQQGMVEELGSKDFEVTSAVGLWSARRSTSGYPMKRKPVLP